jgi:holo-[acyl-carrier protein] synthase
VIIGIGTDIVHIPRIESVLDRQGNSFICRILSETELKNTGTTINAAFIAKRFAAKEAIAKALGTGIGNGVSFHDMSINHDEMGAPYVSLSGGAEKVMKEKRATQVLISISDEQEYAIAYAVLSK